MSALFKGKFLDLLKKCFQSDALVFPDRIRHLKQSEDFERFRSQLYHKKWVVYCKPPFDGVQGVLQYLGRYTHRIAISNNRILNIRNGDVSFLWRDYADQNRLKTMTLKADEFIRRFLLHVLPSRYVRIRHFGLLANRKRKNTIALCRKILGDAKTETQQNTRKETWQEQLLQDLWDRCHPLSRMSERKDVHGGVAASRSMQQPLAVEINPMNHAPTNGSASCENDILFRHGPLLPKITNPRSSRPSVDLFVKILAPVTNPYRYKRANTAPDPPACR